MPDRLVALERVLNFRDFGGYDTPLGRVVRGRLLRSAHFADASDDDMVKLDAMNIAVVVDLRRPEERVREPNKWPGERTRTISAEGGHGDALPPPPEALIKSELTAQSVAAYMHRLYREFAFEPRYIQLYSAWFAELLACDGAAIIHCAAGKDRTGLACALTLHALGVDDDAIFADYELSNAAIDLDARMPRIKARMEQRLGRELDNDALRPMLGVDPAYLRSAFDAIEQVHGARDKYLAAVLGVGERERAALRQRFVA